MTAFATNQLAPSVNTVERLLLWIRNMSYDTMAAAQVQYIDAITGNITTAQRVTIGEFRDTQGVLNYTVTIMVPVSNEILSGAAKPWTYALSMSEIPIPATYGS